MKMEVSEKTLKTDSKTPNSKIKVMTAFFRL